MKLLTNLIFEPKGKHDPALTYTIKDTVMSPDGSKVYFALRNVPPGIALTDEDYWMLQIDLSGSKNAMDEAVAAFADYAKIVGTRVKGETAKATGNPVSFLPDAGSLLQPVTVLEPHQEGSGDPYPAGGGKNLIPFPYMTSDKTENGVTFTVQDDGGIKVTGTAAGVAYFNLCEVHFSDINMSTAGTFTDGSVCLSGAAGGVNIGYSSGNNKTYLFTPSGGAIDTVVYPQVEKGSTPTEYQKHSNIRPITGYDAVKLNHAGKNLFTGWVRGERIDGTTGAFYALATGARTGYIPVKPSEQMQVIGLTATMNSFVAFYNAEKNFIDRTSGYGSEHRTINVPENCHYIAITQYEYSGMSGVIADLSDAVQLEFGASIPTEHTAPTGIEEYTVQIGQTVYGGKFDWLTGKLVADVALLTLTGNEGVARVGTKQFVVFENVSVLNTPYDVNDALCSHFSYDPVSYGSAANGIVTNNRQIIIRYLGLTEDTGDAFKAFIAAQYAAGTPVQIAYKLATPIEIQLTPHILTAVEPEQNNTLYGDGSIDVEYVKPLHVSIEERVAAALAAAAE